MIFSAPIYNDVLNSIWGRYEQIFLRMVASVKNWVNKTRRLIKMSALPLKLANIQKRYTCYSFLKWSVERPLLWYDIGFHEMPIYFAHHLRNFRANIFCEHFNIFCSKSAITFVRIWAIFCVICAKLEVFCKM